MRPFSFRNPACLVAALTVVSTATICAAADPFQISDPQYKLIPLVRHSSPHNAPHIRDAFGNSTNWAGFAAESNLSDPDLGVVTAIAGTWTIPATTGGLKPQSYAYSSAWVGIDGFEDAQLTALFSTLPAAQQKQLILATQTVEQIGTEQDWTGHASSYYAWFEFYPNYAYEIQGFPVKPGDSITGAVTYLGQNRWQSKLTNNTRNLTVTVTATFTADRYSAEWIMEAPSSSTAVLPLAAFGTINFTNCAATIGGKTVTIGAAANEGIDMVNAAGTALRAQTSALNAAGSGFSVAWLSD